MKVKVDHTELTKSQINKILKILPEVYSYLPIDIYLFNDEYQAKEYLSHPMEIEQIEKGCVGGYSAGFNRINIYLFNLDYRMINPSMILFILLHEIRHALQHYADDKGFALAMEDYFSMEHNDIEIEQDADGFALAFIECHYQEICDILHAEELAYWYMPQCEDFIINKSIEIALSA